MNALTCRDGNEVEYSDNEDDDEEDGGSYDESEFDAEEDLDPNAVQDDGNSFGRQCKERTDLNKIELQMKIMEKTKRMSLMKMRRTRLKTMKI